MRYKETDFFHHEMKEKIQELEEAGLYVYCLIDVGDDETLIREWGVCNRYGFLITDQKLPTLDGEMCYDAFLELDPIYDNDLGNVSRKEAA